MSDITLHSKKCIQYYYSTCRRLSRIYCERKIWENIQAFNVEKLEPTNFDVIYNNSLEIPEEKMGLQYLTDGDTKGTAWFQTQNSHHYYTFLSRENGVGESSEPMYIDLKRCARYQKSGSTLIAMSAHILLVRNLLLIGEEAALPLLIRDHSISNVI